jgi:hypothetical protein
MYRGFSNRKTPWHTKQWGFFVKEIPKVKRRKRFYKIKTAKQFLSGMDAAATKTIRMV